MNLITYYRTSPVRVNASVYLTKLLPYNTRQWGKAHAHVRKRHEGRHRLHDKRRAVVVLLGTVRGTGNAADRDRHRPEEIERRLKTRVRGGRVLVLAIDTVVASTVPRRASAPNASLVSPPTEDGGWLEARTSRDSRFLYASSNAH